MQPPASSLQPLASEKISNLKFSKFAAWVQILTVPRVKNVSSCLLIIRVHLGTSFLGGSRRGGTSMWRYFFGGWRYFVFRRYRLWRFPVPPECGGTFLAVRQYGGFFQAVPGTSFFRRYFSDGTEIWRYRLRRFPVLPNMAVFFWRY